jgi:hypothetical protein
MLTVKYALGPLRRMAETAARVAEMPLDRGEVALDARVPEEDTDARTEVGRVGAGIGAMVGNRRGGLGSASAVDGAVQVGALVAVNAFGSVVDPATGMLWAQPWLLEGDLRDGEVRLDAVPHATPLDPFARTRAEVAALRPGALAGARIGVLRFAVSDEPGTQARFEEALAALRAAGAVLVDVHDRPGSKFGADELTVLIAELKVDLGAYLATAAPAVTTRDLPALIAFDRAHAQQELAWFGQEDFDARPTSTTAHTLNPFPRISYHTPSAPRETRLKSTRRKRSQMSRSPNDKLFCGNEVGV